MVTGLEDPEAAAKWVLARPGARAQWVVVKMGGQGALLVARSDNNSSGKAYSGNVGADNGHGGSTCKGTLTTTTRLGAVKVGLCCGA